MARLTGKTAIITGAGQGVGLGIALAYADAGANLVLTGRTAGKLEEAAETLRRRGAAVAICAGDVRSRADAKAAVATAADRFGGLDVLVNNAQSSVPAVPFEQMDDETIRLTLDSGLIGTLQFMQEAFPLLRRKGGSIINMGSREGIFGGKGFGIYAATKEGIRGLSRVAAREWGEHKIRVNVICPAALSPIAVAYLASHPVEADGYRRDIALGYFGDPEHDIAPVALFLAADDSRYVSGQTINADGGLVML